MQTLFRLWKHKHLKRIGILLLLLFTLICLCVLGLVFHLNKRINNSLKKSWFQPPEELIEYYTAPEKIHLEMNVSANQLKKKLKRRYYISLSDKNQLRPGTFIFQTKETCQNKRPDYLFENCLSWQDHHNKDIFIVGFNNNKIVFLRKNHKSVDFVFLKPFLFAQYEKGEPILRKFKPLSDFPFYCLQAVLVAEDHQFITHEGISLKAITRAIWRNLRAGRLAEGGSTITQQLVKNIYFNQKKSFRRKIQEQIMALLLETKLNKDQILTAYLNIVYMGQKGVFRIHGFGSAAEHYIGKPLSRLNISECALIAGLIKSPGRYNPSTNNKQVLHRRNYILDNLYKKQILSKQEWNKAKNKPIKVINQKSSPPTYFTDTVYRKIKNMNLSTKKGLKIFTTLYPDFQEKAQQAVLEGVKWLEKNRLNKELKNNTLQAALVNVDIATGAVRAIVGGRRFKTSQFNRAIQAKRQIGSLMKPVVILTALIKNSELNPLSLVKDAKFTYKYDNQSWSPKNYKENYKGTIPVFEVLTHSLNAGAAQLGIQTGLVPLSQTIKKLGGPSPLMAHPSLTLGAMEMSPWEISQVFLTIAGMGEYKKQHIIEKITNLKGDTLYEYQRQKKMVLNPKKTAVVVGMLKEVTRSGTARWLKKFPAPIAGKTGTTNEEKDAWFVGFTPETLTLVWLGFDNNRSHYLTGAEGALPLWEFFMNKILSSLSKKDFNWPEGVVSRTIPLQKKDSNRTQITPSQKENSETNQKIQLIFEE